MRILFINAVGEIGGAERSLLEIIRAARRERNDLNVTLLSGGDGPLLEEAAKLGAGVALLPMPARLIRMGESGMRRQGTLRNLSAAGLMSPRTMVMVTRYIGELRRVLLRLAPDVIHSNGIKAQLLTGLARPRNTLMIWHIHDFLSQRPLIPRVLRTLASRASRAVAVSEAVAADARPLLGRLPVTTIYNVVDTDRYHPDGPCADLDALANLPPAAATTVRIGILATYARWKGQDVFLRAAGHWLRAAPGARVRFYIIGGPIYRTQGSQFSRAELRALAQHEGIADRVGFVPFQHETAPVYRALDVAVHASVLPEPFGLTIVEAMSSGRAVVVSQAGGAAELFTPEWDAVGVPPGDVAALATTMQRVAHDKSLQHRLGSNARATILHRFDAHLLGPQVLKLYDELTTNSPTTSHDQTAVRNGPHRLRRGGTFQPEKGGRKT